MPTTRSSKKQLRHAKTRTAQNRAQRSQLRTAVRKVRQAETAEARTKAYQDAERLLDRAGRKRQLHPNAAARLKSRLRKLV